MMHMFNFQNTNFLCRCTEFSGGHTMFILQWKFQIKIPLLILIWLIFFLLYIIIYNI